MTERKNSNSDYTMGTYNTYEREYSIEIKPIKLITIGKCSKYYLYILGSVLFNFFSTIITIKTSNNKGLFGFAPILSSYNSMKSIYTYLGYIIFGIFLRFYFKGKSKNKLNKKTNTLNLIHDKLINQDMKKTNFLIILTCISFVIYNDIETFLYSKGYQFLNYWSLEMVFTFLLMKRYFEVYIYRHHICSIIFNIISSSILLLVSSFFPYKSADNQFEFVGNELGNPLYSIVIIFIFAFLSFNFGFSRNFSKILMQSKFVSQYTLIIFIGITGFIFTICLSLFFYYLNQEDNFISYFKYLKTHTTWEILRDVLIISPIYLTLQFMQIYLEILTIYYLNPIYCLMLNNICYSIDHLFSFLFNIDINYLLNFIIYEIAEFVCIFGYMIHLEIIELNFCGLSDNIKRKISIKGEKEFNKLNEGEIGENEEDEDESSYIGIGKYEEMLAKNKNNK